MSNKPLLEERAAPVPDLLPERPAGLERSSRDSFRALGLRLSLLGADITAAVLAFALGFVISIMYRTAIGREAHVLTTWLSDRGAELGLIMILMIGVFAFGGLYSRITWEAEEVRRIFLATGFLALFDIAFQFMFKEHSSRLWFFVAWPLFAVLATFTRAYVRSLPPIRDMLMSKVMVIGSAFKPEEFEYQLRESQANPVQVLGGIEMAQVKDLSTVGLAELITARAREIGLSPGRIRVVLAPNAEERASTKIVSDRLEALGVPFLVTLPEEIPARRGLRVHRIAGLDTIMAEYEYPGLTFPDRLLKRTLDLALTLPAVILLSPLMLVIMLLLKVEGGSIFFVQQRMGQNGRSFGCLKFRSMWEDAEQRLKDLLANDADARCEWLKHQKIANDPRITPIGGLLRRTSLDELPQLINILRGQMSLVGPRPIVSPTVSGYPADRAYHASEEYKYYAACRPGLTGLWQVSGRARTSHQERVRLDTWYACNWSFWLDVAIIFKTVRVVLFTRSAS